MVRTNLGGGGHGPYIEPWPQRSGHPRRAGGAAGDDGRLWLGRPRGWQPGNPPPPPDLVSGPSLPPTHLPSHKTPFLSPVARLACRQAAGGGAGVRRLLQHLGGRGPPVLRHPRPLPALTIAISPSHSTVEMKRFKNRCSICGFTSQRGWCLVHATEFQTSTLTSCMMASCSLKVWKGAPTH